MKFIGQFIQDFIARFRNDVYLEDIDTGTIVSGGNLGLDSNNKIVKNTVSGGGTTDLTSDVTGVLPVGNGGTGLTSISTLLNSNTTKSDVGLGNVENTALSTYTGSGGALDNQYIANGAGYTTNTGDITSVKFTSSVGSHTESSGAAEFVLAGTLPLSVTNVNETFTVTAANASTTSKGVASFNSSDFSVSSGAVSLVTKYAYQYISFVGNITANTNGNGYWEYPSPNGISNHTWTQIVQTTTGSVDNRDTTTVGDSVGIDRLNQGSAGIRIPYAGTIVGFTGSGRNASGNRAYYGGLFVGTPDWGTTNKIDAELVAVAQADASPGGNLQSRPAKVEDLSRSYSISAGDVIYPAIKGSGTNADVIQISWTIVIKTPIV